MTTAKIPELAQFSAILQTTELDPRCIEQAGENVRHLIEAFEALPENRASIRVRRPIRTVVRRTLRHLTSAARQVGDRSITRKEARKLIRFAGCCENFSILKERASKYRGRRNKVAHRINERKAREGAREIWLDDRHSAAEINTVSHLRSVGRRLRNCIGGRLGSDYRAALRRGESEFWALRREGMNVGLLAIDTVSRTIEECAGVDNEPLGWERELLLKLQRALDVTGDQIEECVESGAFSLFLHQPNLRPVRARIDQRTYQIWGGTGEFIVCEDGKRWSRFRLTREHRRGIPICEVDFGSALDIDELVYLVAASPELREVVVQSQPEKDLPNIDLAASGW
ncbi:MAG: hypothetical protein F4229_05515 [Gammaproteobacteria bacterium]|nr:hypothetical protein [Gammaproteobacteria bacterium]